MEKPKVYEKLEGRGDCMMIYTGQSPFRKQILDKFKNKVNEEGSNVTTKVFELMRLYNKEK